MTPAEEQYVYQRQRRMPDMIEATERKYLGLLREAKRYGMHDILSSKYHSDRAWDREIVLAKLEAAYSGGETTIAGDGV